MGSRWQVAFSVGPLALYLYLLARGHGGRYPRVVSGLVDFALLSLAGAWLAWWHFRPRGGPPPGTVS